MTDPYRDEAAAAQQKLAEISAELEQIDAAVARSHALREEAHNLHVRLERLRQRDPLENVRIASPCSADWNRMDGDDRVRFCGECKKNVYNTAGMTRAEARELLSKNARGDLCLRIYRREDGTVLTSDCPVGASDKRKKEKLFAVVVAGAVGALGIAGAFTLFRSSPGVAMGKMAADDEDRVVMGAPTAPPPSVSASGPATEPSGAPRSK